MGWHNWGHKGSHAGPATTTTTTPTTGESATLTVTFQSEEAGYANTMGWYNARTGEAGVLFKNLNDDGANAAVHAGDTRTLTVQQSDLDANNIGFFLIPNGANEYSSSTLSSTMRFEVGSNGDGRIVIDRAYGHDVVLNGNEVLFSNQTYNKGDYDYVSGTVGTDGQTKVQKFGTQSDGPDGILGTMAWDDQAVQWCNKGTDRDFNDVVFTVTKQGSTNPPTNSAPTDINLSSASIGENVAGAVVGALTTVDPNAGDTHTYTVSDDRFEVVGGLLQLKAGVSLNHEATASVVVTVTSTDQGGLSISENFTIAVGDANEAPTDINLSNASVDENLAGAVIGTLSTADPDAGDAHTYTVSDDRFEVVSGQLKLKDGVSLDHEAAGSLVVTVTSADQGGLGVSEDFTITVTDANEAPTDIGLSNLDVDESEGAIIGTLSTTDLDVGDSHQYTVDDERFEVVGDQLQLKAGVSLDNESEPTVTINVTSTDLAGQSVTKGFTINVANLNEAPDMPIDDDPADDFVSESAAIGTVVGITASSSDPDVGDTVSYSLSNDAGGLFAIDPVTGVVTVAGALDYDTATQHTITIRATDSHGDYGESDFIVEVGDDPSQAMAFGSSGSDMFLFDLSQAVANTLVGFDPQNDTLSFTGVADTDSNGIDLNDLLALVSGINDFGSGADIVVDFTTGASLIFQGAGTGGTAPSFTGLVANPASQIQVA
jgi:hypothetical protein